MSDKTCACCNEDCHSKAISLTEQLAAVTAELARLAGVQELCGIETAERQKLEQELARLKGQKPIDFAPFNPPFHVSGAVVCDSNGDAICMPNLHTLDVVVQITQALNRACGVEEKK